MVKRSCSFPTTTVIVSPPILRALVRHQYKWGTSTHKHRRRSISSKPSVEVRYATVWTEGEVRRGIRTNGEVRRRVLSRSLEPGKRCLQCLQNSYRLLPAWHVFDALTSARVVLEGGLLCVLWVVLKLQTMRKPFKTMHHRTSNGLESRSLVD